MEWKRLFQTDIKIIDGDRGVNYPNKSEFYNSEFCLFLTTKNVTKEGFDFTINQFITESKDKKLSKGKLSRNDVILTTRGTVGNVGFYSKDIKFDNIRINSGMVILRSNDIEYSSQFLYYVFKSAFMQEQIQLFSSGTAQPQLPIKDLKRLNIPYVDLNFQNSISSILSGYDDLIVINNQRITILENISKELYKEWFVRMRFPNYKKGKFIKGIPENWETKKLGLVIELAYGKALKDEDRKGGEFPVYGSSGIVGSHDTFISKAPGIIVGRKGNVGSIFWVTKDFYPIDTAFYVKSKISLYYTYFNLQLQHFIEADSAVPGLSRSQVYSNYILLPPQDLLDKFDGIVKPIFEMISNLEEQNNQLQQIRGRLLPRLINGKLQVKNSIKLPQNISA